MELLLLAIWDAYRFSLPHISIILFYVLHSIKTLFRMGRQRERRANKGIRKQWQQEDMIKALSAVRKKEMGYLKAYNVPRQTLFRLSSLRKLFEPN